MILPTTEIAVITAMTNFPTTGFPRPNPMKNGTHAKNAMILEMMLYFRSANSLPSIQMVTGIRIREMTMEIHVLHGK